jgi:hypothetical protein
MSKQSISTPGRYLCFFRGRLHILKYFSFRNCLAVSRKILKIKYWPMLPGRVTFVFPIIIRYGRHLNAIIRVYPQIVQPRNCLTSLVNNKIVWSVYLLLAPEAFHFPSEAIMSQLSTSEGCDLAFRESLILAS